MQNKPDFSFRMVDEKSADILTALHEECFPRYWNREAFTDFFSAPNTFAVLAELGDIPAGMFIYRTAHEQADIITIAVRPAYRRCGLAKTMLLQGMQHCKELGAELLFLEVEVGNDAAIKLYEGLGFTHVSRRKLYYQQLDGTYTDALVMKRKLG
jgi:[ribosomal protein S18]-alanine N-acetyltransferase